VDNINDLLPQFWAKIYLPLLTFTVQVKQDKSKLTQQCEGKEISHFFEVVPNISSVMRMTNNFTRTLQLVVLFCC